MAKDPAYLMYYKDWLVSTAGWDADMRGWYINLLCHQADKPAGLENDLESLAELAGVKISQFPRFSECWKRTLAAKFEANAQGLLVNKSLAKVVTDRKGYSDKQVERGTIGHFIKRAIKEHDISSGVRKALYDSLVAQSFVSKNKEEREECYKHTLIALLGDAIANANTIEKEGGTGEERDIDLPKVKNPDQYPVHQLNAVWRAAFPDYPGDASSDAPALLAIAEFIRKQKRLPADYSQAAVRDAITEYWKPLVAFIAEDKHYCTYSLERCRKHLQSIIQAFNAPRSGPKSELQLLYEKYCETGKIGLKQIQESYFTDLNERGFLPPVSDKQVAYARRIRIENLQPSDLTKDGKLRQAYEAQQPTDEQLAMIEADKANLILHGRRCLVKDFFTRQKDAGATNIYHVKKPS